MSSLLFRRGTRLESFSAPSPSVGGWTRRQWLTHQAIGFAVAGPWLRHPGAFRGGPGWAGCSRPVDPRRLAAQGAALDPAAWETLAQRGVNAAQGVGARYAEARLTRLVLHRYHLGGLVMDYEIVGVGIRALVGGAWGFSASTVATSAEIDRLAHDAVGQARENVRGATGTVDLGQYPVARGRWATPVPIDPFGVSIEEKADFFGYWYQCAQRAGLGWVEGGAGIANWLDFSRREEVVATSEGALFTQTFYESAGIITVQEASQVPFGGSSVTQLFPAIHVPAAQGWERFLDARIGERFLSGEIGEQLAAQSALPHKLFTMGRYTLVCDGATMAALVEATLGVATQLDRALGYEADDGGTSWLNDPLAMLGTARVAAPLVTVTANRSAPAQLATVRWDTEGVAPADFTLVKDGVLMDFQTTREHAAWLAPYYQAHGQPVRSHGCAAVQSAHGFPLPQMPNLMLQPTAAAVSVAELVAGVKEEGILVEQGQVAQMDFQGRTGILTGRMRQIRNGRVGAILDGGVVLFDSRQLWNAVEAVGGAATVGQMGVTPYDSVSILYDSTNSWQVKGQPSQGASHTVQAAAATIANQPVIDPRRRG